jgi:hypothetical protein
MNNKNKLIGLGALVIVSIVMALYNFSGSRNDKNIGKDNEHKVESEITNKTESSSDDIKESDITPSYTNNQEKPIWIKNITLLSDNNQNFDTIMMLKSKLNEELKTIDKDTFEVELIEDTYVENDKGFSVEAKADKIDGKILIEYADYEYTFSVIQN